MPFCPKNRKLDADYWSEHTPLTLQGDKVLPCVEADHLGILRSVAGTTPSIISRIAAHTKALHAVLPLGLAKSHSGHPAANLRVEEIYALPVLLSGLASLVLSKSNITTLALHHKQTTERLSKLYRKTPRAAVYFIAGCLPFEATLHLRQLGLLAMVARLGSGHPLHTHAINILEKTSPPKESWFTCVSIIMAKYNLPSTLSILQHPPSKLSWNIKTKTRVTSVWHQLLTAEANDLPSLSHLRASHLSLSRPHSLYRHCPPLSHELNKAILQARILSGRFISCWRRRHWDHNGGICRLCGHAQGDVEHIFTGHCPTLSDTGRKCMNHWMAISKSDHLIRSVIMSASSGNSTDFLSFLLDPSTVPFVISITQESPIKEYIFDTLFHMTRTWLYLHHKERNRLLELL